MRVTNPIVALPSPHQTLSVTITCHLHRARALLTCPPYPFSPVHPPGLGKKFDYVLEFIQNSLLFPNLSSVKTDLMGTGANSTILVARVNKSDSGNYSCSISPDQFYTVTVHVLNGKWHFAISFHIYDIHKLPGGGPPPEPERPGRTKP